MSQPTELRIRLFQSSRRVKPTSRSDHVGVAASPSLSERVPPSLSERVPSSERFNIGVYAVRVPSAHDARQALMMLPPESIAASSKTFYNSPQVTLLAARAMR